MFLKYYFWVLNYENVALNDIKVSKTNGANSRLSKPRKRYFLVHLNPCLRNGVISLTLWNVSKLSRGAYFSMVYMYTAHKPDQRFSWSFQCEFRSRFHYPIWLKFKSMGSLFIGFKNWSTNIWDKSRMCIRVCVNSWVIGKMGWQETKVTWEKYESRIGTSYFFFFLSKQQILVSLFYKFWNACALLCSQDCIELFRAFSLYWVVIIVLFH